MFFGKVVLFCIILGLENGKFDFNHFPNFLCLVFFQITDVLRK